MEEKIKPVRIPPRKNRIIILLISAACLLQPQTSPAEDDYEYLKDIKRGATPYQYHPEEHMNLSFDDHKNNPPDGYQAEKTRVIYFMKALAAINKEKSGASEDCAELIKFEKELSSILDRVNSPTDMGDADFDLRAHLSSAWSILERIAENNDCSEARRKIASHGGLNARSAHQAAMRFKDSDAISYSKKVLEAYRWLLKDAGCY